MGFGIRYTGWELNLNLQPIIKNGDNFSLYGSTGLGIFGIKAAETVTGFGAGEVFFGLNTGVGFDVKLSKNLFFNFEPKFTMFIEDGKLGYRGAVSAGLVIKF